MPARGPGGSGCGTCRSDPAAGNSWFLLEEKSSREKLCNLHAAARFSVGMRPRRQPRRCSGYSPGKKLHGQQLLDAVLVHVGPCAVLYDLAALHDDVLVGERAREIVVLLHQQD